MAKLPALIRTQRPGLKGVLLVGGVLLALSLAAIYLIQTPPGLSSTTDSWRRTNFTGSYSFEYPNGWHVTNSWLYDVDDPTLIYLDPEPINTAPRGGPISAITIRVQASLADPLETFREAKESIKENVSGLEEEAIETESATVYGGRGEVQIYTETVPWAEYVVLLEGALPGTLDTRVVEIEGPVEYADVMWRVATSSKLEEL